jgi:hypothetical protein
MEFALHGRIETQTVLDRQTALERKIQIFLDNDHEFLEWNPGAETAAFWAGMHMHKVQTSRLQPKIKLK